MTTNNFANINTNTALSSMMTKILWRQQQDLINKHPNGVNVVINDEDPLDIQANIEGPKDTPYEGGTFRVKLVVTPSFPQVAPKGFFMTKIYHPNVSEKGEICVNTLKKDWNPRQWSLFNILEVVKCLLIVPFPESSLNEEAGKLFMEDYDSYFRIAAIFTNVHAGGSIKSKQDLNTIETTCFTNNSDGTNFNISHNLNSYNNSESNDGFKTPSGVYLNNTTSDFSLLRHAKSVMIKSSAALKINDNNNIGGHRKSAFLDTDNSFKMDFSNTDFKISQKPSINSLPYITRSNSFVVNNAENHNNFHFIPGDKTDSNNFINGTTPSRSKKDEIKKWLSRI